MTIHQGSPRGKCDLVMKGGITSGIVYPKAVAELARVYEFAAIGGTSAGAIAAAATAAAELGRRRLKRAQDPDPQAPFEELARIPEELGQFIGKDTRLASLFQPSAATRPTFKLLFAIVGVKGSIGWLVLKGLLRAAPGAAIGSALSTLTIVLLLAVLTQSTNWLTVASAFVLSAIAAIIGPAMVIRSQIVTELPANSFGMCSGMPAGSLDRTADLQINRNTVPVDGALALTEWLHILLQDVARQDRARPVTFFDLWSGGEARPPHLERDQTQDDLVAGKERQDLFDKLHQIHREMEGREREIELVLVTTNATRGLTYQFPFVVGTKGSLAYSPSEFRTLFPASVVDWMVKHSPGVSQDRMAQTLKVSKSRNVSMPDDLRWLPHPADVPILVGTRMSLSFPLLLTAVPLYTPNMFYPNVEDRAVNTKLAREEGLKIAPEKTWPQDSEQTREQLEKLAPLQRCWFSDGGLTSNFPIHLFDSPLPSRPTFAIDLADADAFNPRLEPYSDRSEPDEDAPDGPETMVQMARTNSSGRSMPFVDLDYGPSEKRLAAFFMALFDASRNWADNQMTVMPGYRDRIARIAMRSSEGGLNLNMPTSTIKRVAERGEHAAQMLIRRFDGVTRVDPETGEPVRLTWENHQWVRYRSFMAGLEHLGRNFLASWTRAAQRGNPYSDLMQRDPGALPSYPWTAEQQKKAIAATEGFIDFVEKNFANPPFDPDLESGTPRAKARWRGMPPLDDDPRGERVQLQGR